MKKIFLILLTIGFNFVSNVFAELPQTVTKQVHHDPFGVWQTKPRDFEQVTKKGARVVNMPEEDTFFAYWIPPKHKSGRIIVSVHGTGGNPYIALKDEFDWAEKFDYAVIAVSWFSPERGFLSAQDLYRNILESLNFLQSKFGHDLSRVAYIGFSRGAAVSYEVAYLDNQSEKIFDVFIAHSGGIPLDLKVESRNQNSFPDPFFSQLVKGQLPKDAFTGTKFFLYSGDRDESWGPVMSQQMGYARQLIEANGGEVLEWVRDSHDGHMGFLRNPVIKTKALQYFMKISSESH